MYTNYFLRISLTFFVIFYSSLALAENEEVFEEAGPVVFAHILYRHGERTPEVPYPNDPYKNDSFWKVGWGQLTNNGKLQHFSLGQWLRLRYLHLIPDGQYSPKIIYVQSTDMDRTLMSALSNLAGMFPPIGDQQWNQLDWQPIPVNTVPQILDKVLAMKYPCPKFAQDYNALLKSKKMIEFNRKYKELYMYLSEHAGEPIKDAKNTEYLFSTLRIEALNNYTLPNWTSSVFPDKMYPVAAFSFAQKTLTKKLQRLRTGPLFKEMVLHMTDKRSGQLIPDRNLWMYSAHDTTVADVLNTLGVFDPHTPPFTATVLIELRKNKDNAYSVTVLYKNTTVEPMLMTLPGCTSACPLDKFISLYQDIIPVDWDSECHLHQLFDLTSDQPYNSLAIFAMVTSTLLVFLLLASTSLYWHKQKPAHLYKKLKMESL